MPESVIPVLLFRSQSFSYSSDLYRSLDIVIVIEFLNHFFHEYSCKAPPTKNRYIINFHVCT